MNQPKEPIGQFSRALADLITEEMSARGLVQEDVAAIIGSSQATVSKRQDKIYPWTLPELEKLAPKFGMTVPQLMALAGQRAAQENPLDNMSVEEIEKLPNSAPTPRKKS